MLSLIGTDQVLEFGAVEVAAPGAVPAWKHSGNISRMTSYRTGMGTMHVLAKRARLSPCTVSPVSGGAHSSQPQLEHSKGTARTARTKHRLMSESKLSSGGLAWLQHPAASSNRPAPLAARGHLPQAPSIEQALRQLSPLAQIPHLRMKVESVTSVGSGPRVCWGQGGRVLGTGQA